MSLTEQPLQTEALQYQQKLLRLAIEAAKGTFGHHGLGGDGRLEVWTPYVSDDTGDDGYRGELLHDEAVSIPTAADRRAVLSLWNTKYRDGGRQLAGALVLHRGMEDMSPDLVFGEIAGIDGHGAEAICYPGGEVRQRTFQVSKHDAKTLFAFAWRAWALAAHGRMPVCSFCGRDGDLMEGNARWMCRLEDDGYPSCRDLYRERAWAYIKERKAASLAGKDVPPEEVPYCDWVEVGTNLGTAQDHRMVEGLLYTTLVTKHRFDGVDQRPATRLDECWRCGSRKTELEPVAGTMLCRKAKLKGGFRVTSGECKRRGERRNAYDRYNRIYDMWEAFVRTTSASPAGRLGMQLHGIARIGSSDSQYAEALLHYVSEVDEHIVEKMVKYIFR